MVDWIYCFDESISLWLRISDYCVVATQCSSGFMRHSKLIQALAVVVSSSHAKF